MKRLILIMTLSVAVTGCNAIKRIMPHGAGQNTPPAAQQADDYTVTGTTLADYQIIQPVRVIDSTLIIRVKRAGEDWHQCNKYEVRISTSGPGGGEVTFRKICYPTVSPNGNLLELQITNKPVAPAGTLYEVRSIRTGVSSLELY